MVLLPVDGDTLGEDSEPAKGNGESVLFDLKNINKDAVHKIEAPIDLVEDQFTAFYVYLLGDFFM